MMSQVTIDLWVWLQGSPRRHRYTEAVLLGGKMTALLRFDPWQIHISRTFITRLRNKGPLVRPTRCLFLHLRAAEGQ